MQHTTISLFRAIMNIGLNMSFIMSLWLILTSYRSFLREGGDRCQVSQHLLGKLSHGTFVFPLSDQLLFIFVQMFGILSLMESFKKHNKLVAQHIWAIAKHLSVHSASLISPLSVTNATTLLHPAPWVYCKGQTSASNYIILMFFCFVCFFGSHTFLIWGGESLQVCSPCNGSIKERIKATHLLSLK